MEIGSNYLMKKCGTFTSSGSNILPHVHLRGQENVETLKSVLQYQVRYLPAALKVILELSQCFTYNLADGKSLYLLCTHTLGK